MILQHYCWIVASHFRTLKTKYSSASVFFFKVTDVMDTECKIIKYQYCTVTYINRTEELHFFKTRWYKIFKRLCVVSQVNVRDNAETNFNPYVFLQSHISSFWVGGDLIKKIRYLRKKALMKTDTGYNHNFSTHLGKVRNSPYRLNFVLLWSLGRA